MTGEQSETRTDHEDFQLRKPARDALNHYLDEWRTRTWFGKVCLPFEVGTVVLILVVISIPLSLLLFFQWYMQKLDEAGAALKSLLPSIYKND